MAVNGIYSSNSSSFYTMSNVYQTNSQSGSAADLAGVDVVKSVANADKSQISDAKKKNETDATTATGANKNKNTQKTKQPASSNTEIKFQHDKGTNTTMIQIVDQNTGKVVKEIPPESILKSVAQIWKTAGIKIDQNA